MTESTLHLHWLPDREVTEKMDLERANFAIELWNYKGTPQEVMPAWPSLACG